eukprot:121481-Pyramimonas_sp.AAC.1
MCASPVDGPGGWLGVGVRPDGPQKTIVCRDDQVEKLERDEPLSTVSLKRLPSMLLTSTMGSGRRC